MKKDKNDSSMFTTTRAGKQLLTKIATDFLDEWLEEDELTSEISRNCTNMVKRLTTVKDNTLKFQEFQKIYQKTIQSFKEKVFPNAITMLKSKRGESILWKVFLSKLFLKVALAIIKQDDVSYELLDHIKNMKNKMEKRWENVI